MFKSFREAKARIQVGSLVEQINALLVYNNIRLTPGQWDDPYLYGYFTGMTIIPLKVGSSGKLAGESISTVQAWGWEMLTGIAAKGFIRRAEALATGKDADYVRGINAGILWGALVTGTARRDNPAVSEAIEVGRQLGNGFRQATGGEPNDLQDAAAYVMTRDLYTYLRKAAA